MLVMALGWLPYRDEVAEQLIVHVCLRQERRHKQLLLPHADPWRAVNVTVQVHPATYEDCTVSGAKRVHLSS
jgi:hypothetical protein